MAAARLMPAAPFGEWMLHANTLLMGAAVVAIAVALRMWLRSWLVTASVGLALALGALPVVTRSPFEPVMYLVAIGTIGALKSESRQARWLAALGVVATILIRPCVGWSGVVTSAGPYAIGLAALGAFSMLMKARGYGSLALIAYVTLTTVAPAFVGFWICVAAGLRELQTRAAGMQARVAAAALIALLPVLQLSSIGSGAAAPAAFGAERLSADDLHHLLAVLPDNSVLVDDDPSVSILSRSGDDARGKMGKRFRVEAPDPIRLAGIVAEPDTRVFALPAAQSRLMWLGFRLAEAPLFGVTGLARVASGGTCHLVTRRWTEIPAPSSWGTTVLSVIRKDAAPEHAVVMYVASDAAFRPSVFGEESRTRTGFSAEVYNVSLPADREWIERHAREDRQLTEIAGPFIARLELWRSASVPQVLPIQIERPASRILVRSSANTESDLVCPAFPYEIKDIQIQR